MKHTPTPWKKSQRVNERHAIRIIGNGMLVAEARAAGGSWTNAKANADFIVQAVNAYDELLGAVKALHALADGHPYEAQATTLKWTHQLIAKAEGRK